MHHDNQSHSRPALDFQKTNQPVRGQGAAAEAGLEADRETFGQIVIKDGVPSSVAATAGLAVAGIGLGPALFVGAVTGLAFTLLRTNSQS